MKSNYLKLIYKIKQQISDFYAKISVISNLFSEKVGGRQKYNYPPITYWMHGLVLLRMRAPSQMLSVTFLKSTVCSQTLKQFLKSRVK